MVREQRDPAFWQGVAEHAQSGAFMRRTLDPALLNRVQNMPEVRARSGGGFGEIDHSPLIGNPANVCLVNDHGGFMFQNLGSQRYELHTLFMPGCRGRQALDAAAEAFRYLFTSTDCMELLTKAPAKNPAADLMARKAGFSERFRREDAWIDGGAMTYFDLTFEAWLAQDARVAAEGHSFHEKLEQAKAEAGSTLPTHPDDEAHDRAAGAACLMAKAGDCPKAVWTYNRWAVFAGYQTIELLAPAIIDARDAVFEARGGELHILYVRP